MRPHSLGNTTSIAMRKADVWRTGFRAQDLSGLLTARRELKIFRIFWRFVAKQGREVGDDLGQGTAVSARKATHALRAVLVCTILLIVAGAGYLCVDDRRFVDHDNTIICLKPNSNCTSAKLSIRVATSDTGSEKNVVSFVVRTHNKSWQTVSIPSAVCQSGFFTEATGVPVFWNRLRDPNNTVDCFERSKLLPMMWRTDIVTFKSPDSANTVIGAGILNVLLIESESQKAHFFELSVARGTGK